MMCHRLVTAKSSGLHACCRLSLFSGKLYSDLYITFNSETNLIVIVHCAKYLIIPKCGEGWNCIVLLFEMYSVAV